VVENFPSQSTAMIFPSKSPLIAAFQSLQSAISQSLGKPLSSAAQLLWVNVTFQSGSDIHFDSSNLPFTLALGPDSRSRSQLC
jgi:hypothetical protein